MFKVQTEKTNEVFTPIPNLWSLIGYLFWFFSCILVFVSLLCGKRGHGHYSKPVYAPLSSIRYNLEFWGSVNEVLCIALSNIYNTPFLLQCICLSIDGEIIRVKGLSEWLICLCIIGVAFNIWPTFRTPFSEFSVALLSFTPLPHIPLLSLSLSLFHTHKRIDTTVLFHLHLSCIKLLVFSYNPFFCTSLFPLLLRRWA